MVRGRSKGILEGVDRDACVVFGCCSIKEIASPLLKIKDKHRFVFGHFIGCDVHLDRFSLHARSIQQKEVAGVKSIKSAPNEATAEALLIGHETPWSKQPFDCIASVEQNHLI